MRLLLSQVAIAMLALAQPIFVVGQISSSSQIVVSENTLVSPRSLKLPLVEPWVATNPKDPKHLLATAMLGPYSADADCVAFVSFNRGKTWSQHNFGVPGCADPWIVLREDKTAVFSGLEIPGNKLRLARSTDGGRTWSHVPVDFGAGHDHETMVVDTSNGPHAGSIYLVSGKARRGQSGQPTWSIFATRSADDGQKFMPPTHITPSNLNYNVLDPVVLSDGTLVLPYKDFQSNLSDFRGRAGELDRKRAWVITSNDGGLTFSYSRFVSEGCGLGFGFLDVDESNRPTRDSLYFVCLNRELNGILVHHSQDRGEKWSMPVRADSAGGEVVFRQTPSVAVNRDGVVGVTWYERRKEADQNCQYLYFAASLDGGKTFLPQTRVSSEPSCPDNVLNGRTASRWPAGGDYSGFAAESDGTFRALWADSRDGLYRLWTATIKVTATNQ